MNAHLSVNRRSWAMIDIGQIAFVSGAGKLKFQECASQTCSIHFKWKYSQRWFNGNVISVPMLPSNTTSFTHHKQKPKCIRAWHMNAMLVARTFCLFWHRTAIYSLLNVIRSRAHFHLLHCFSSFLFDFPNVSFDVHKYLCWIDRKMLFSFLVYFLPPPLLLSSQRWAQSDRHTRIVVPHSIDLQAE